jgi:hypothetical protein
VEQVLDALGLAQHVADRTVPPPQRTEG